MDYIIYSFDGKEYMTVNQIKDFIENNAVVGYDIDAEISYSIRRLSAFIVVDMAVELFFFEKANNSILYKLNLLKKNIQKFNRRVPPQKV